MRDQTQKEMEEFQPYMKINNNPLALSIKADLQNSAIKIGSSVHESNAKTLDPSLPKYSQSKVAHSFQIQ